MRICPGFSSIQTQITCGASSFLSDSLSPLYIFLLVVVFSLVISSLTHICCWLLLSSDNLSSSWINYLNLPCCLSLHLAFCIDLHTCGSSLSLILSCCVVVFPALASTTVHFDRWLSLKGTAISWSLKHRASLPKSMSILKLYYAYSFYFILLE